jgi:hypothetical protein
VSGRILKKASGDEKRDKIETSSKRQTNRDRQIGTGNRRPCIREPQRLKGSR